MEVAFLHPRLPTTVAVSLASELGSQPPEAAAAMAAVEHFAAVYGPTGGTRVPRQRLEDLRRHILEVATKHGYPRKPSQDQARAFDALIAVYLFEGMRITPHEAAQHGVWQFFCCVLLPDVVRWRFPGGPHGTAAQRYVGGVRNTFGRLWWRALVLMDEQAVVKDHLIKGLNEDELVQIMERPTLAGNRILSQQIAKAFLSQLSKSGNAHRFGRMMLMREAQKRIMRLFPLMAFDVMGVERLSSIVQAQFLEALAALQRERKREHKEHTSEEPAAYLV